MVRKSQLKPSEILRKQIGKLEFKENFSTKKKKIPYSKFLEIAQKAALTFKDDEPNRRRDLYL